MDIKELLASTLPLHPSEFEELVSCSFVFRFPQNSAYFHKIVHQRSVLSPLLFAIAVHAITEYGSKDLMNEIFYADNVILKSKSTENLREKFLK